MLRIAMHERNLGAMHEAFQSAFQKAGAKGSLHTHHLYRVALDLVGHEEGDIEVIARCTEVLNNLLEGEGVEDEKLAILIQECSDAVIICRTKCQSDEATM